MHEVWVLAQQRMMDVLGEVTLAQLAPAPAPSPA
jgi:DNA-binding IscR family transcriptional regulator